VLHVQEEEEDPEDELQIVDWDKGAADEAYREHVSLFSAKKCASNKHPLSDLNFLQAGLCCIREIYQKTGP
jgi:hypothetical protein